MPKGQLTNRFDRVNVVVAEPDEDLREHISDELRKLGFARINLVKSIHDIQKSLSTNALDLLICDTTLNDGDLTSVVRGIRLDIFKGDIFPVVVTLVSDSSTEIVRKVIDSGTDAVLVKPILMDHLHQRILKLTAKRARFVVTSTYIGPDRRQKPREGKASAPSFDVPNPLQNKVTGYYNEQKYQELVRRTTVSLNEQRIERQSAQIKYYVERILPEYEQKNTISEMPPEWRRVSFSARDLAKRVKGSRFSHMIGISTSLTDFIDDVACKGHLNSEDIRLLVQFSNAVSRLFETA